jgi:hypothetical protein
MAHRIVDWIEPEEFFEIQPESSLINQRSSWVCRPCTPVDEARATRRATCRVAPAPVKTTSSGARCARRSGAIRRRRLNCRTGGVARRAWAVRINRGQGNRAVRRWGEWTGPTFPLLGSTVNRRTPLNRLSDRLNGPASNANDLLYSTRSPYDQRLNGGLIGYSADFLNTGFD